MLAAIPNRLEPSELERHRARRASDLGVLTAHDPGESDRYVVSVTDQQLLSGQDSTRPVERRQRLTVGGEPDTDPVPSEGGQVVGVVRLVEFEHHVVADIDDVVDRSLTDGTTAEPPSTVRSGDGDAGQHGQGEPAASLSGDDVDGDVGRATPTTGSCGCGGVNGSRNLAARSRATPTCPKASGRLRVTSTSKMTSWMRPVTSPYGTPSGAPEATRRCHCGRSPSPSSRAEQSMPSDGMPRMPRESIVRPSGISVPIVASGTTSPGAKFDAPHHT